MSRTQYKKIWIDLIHSSGATGEIVDTVFQTKSAFPKLPRDIWLKIWSFRFGEDVEQYTNIDKNLSKRKAYGQRIKNFRKSIEMLESSINEINDTYTLTLESYIIKLDSFFSEENLQIESVYDIKEKMCKENVKKIETKFKELIGVWQDVLLHDTSMKTKEILGILKIIIDNIHCHIFHISRHHRDITDIQIKIRDLSHMRLYME